ncbi:MAG: hypothetical protein JW990_13745, partial [Thermoleophilia bacterium]|nr:hypothetical protein [Thermoleophilia bacterium]
LPPEGDVCLVTYPLGFARMTDLMFSRIRQYSRGSVPVTVRLLESIAAVGPRVKHEAGRSALMAQANMLKRSSDEAIPEPDDRRLVDLRFKAVERALVEPAP